MMSIALSILLRAPSPRHLYLPEKIVEGVLLLSGKGAVGVDKIPIHWVVVSSAGE